MDSNYLDFGSDTDSDGEGMGNTFDSDEEEAEDNAKLFKMIMMTSTNPVSKKVRDVDDFEAEMEAELDKRALEIENFGGLKHQKTLSRSSSNSSLNRDRKSPCISPSTSRSQSPRQGSCATRSWIEEISDKNPPSTSKVICSSSAGASAGPSPSSTKTTTDSVTKINRPRKKSVKFEENSIAKSSSLQNNTDKMETDDVGDEKEDGDKPKPFYDDIYFDSDESEGEDENTKKVKKEKRSFQSNDDLFYDPESDSKDQQWMDNHRRKYCQSPTSSSSGSGGGPKKSKNKKSDSKSDEQPLPSSDAVLNCPACFTVLCVDCQRHEIYTSQYRAMFVMNCNVARDVTLQVPLKDKSSKWKRRKKTSAESSDAETNLLNPAHLPASDKFNPVKCKICTTQVAVYDSDEIYHFFNVLASHA